MRVITGTARGTNLKAPAGLSTRPTGDKVKQALFNMIQYEIAGDVLDLFAGSGQLGIEALSRGAESAVFVDADKNAVRIVKENLAKTKLDSRATVVQTDSIAFLSMTDRVFDLAFLDPPYERGFLQKALAKMDGLISEGGAVICEHPFKEELEERYGSLVKTKEYKYSKTAVTVYRKEG